MKLPILFTHPEPLIFRIENMQEITMSWFHCQELPAIHISYFKCQDVEFAKLVKDTHFSPLSLEKCRKISFEEAPIIVQKIFQSELELTKTD